ncbi:hypothetical protein RFI_03653 [Reticulomyxa filosa]|uniref:Uncharacterized protein n=1 Tax=Reticulomyxa filosa TaxID=46433 RepID=X6P5U1_RETFI|nr:hypothetical protein RFI_03653 [Reticulomyxa filosa]|eukprot:ETO33454.1 hypothetical protein RFI_03653 [Reticulomyxa filosa]
MFQSPEMDEKMMALLIPKRKDTNFWRVTVNVCLSFVFAFCCWFVMLGILNWGAVHIYDKSNRSQGSNVLHLSIMNERSNLLDCLKCLRTHMGEKTWQELLSMKNRTLLKESVPEMARRLQKSQQIMSELCLFSLFVCVFQKFVVLTDDQVNLISVINFCKHGIFFRVKGKQSRFNYVFPNAKRTLSKSENKQQGKNNLFNINKKVSFKTNGPLFKKFFIDLFQYQDIFISAGSKANVMFTQKEEKRKEKRESNLFQNRKDFNLKLGEI